MKKISIFISLLLLSVLHLSAQNTTNQIITLSHNGIETNFAANQITESIATAVDGDTLFLSPGEFEQDFIINKALTLIGTGADSDDDWGKGSTFTGNIDVNISNSSQLPNLSFAGIHFKRKVSLSCPLNNLVFRKCQIDTYFHYNYPVEKLTIDKCILDFYQGASGSHYDIKQLIATNSKFTSIYPYIKNYDYSSWQFRNCTIKPYFMSYKENGWFCNLEGTYYNCIIENRTYPLNVSRSQLDSPLAILINCLYENYNKDENLVERCTLENCYTSETENIKVSELTTEELLQNNYIGTDGTIIGCYGGDNPFSVTINAPKASSSKVHYNKESKQLEININLK